MPKFGKLILIYFSIFLLSLSLNLDFVFAFPSSSANYKLEGEFGNFGGAKSSANYRLTDTGGGFAPGITTSGNYRNCSGFQCVIAEVPKITFSLSTNAINLGTLSTGSVNTNSHTMTVITNVGGYNVTVVEDGNLRNGAHDINDVSGGTVDAGTEEYGLSTTDTDAGLDIALDATCGSGPYNATGVNASPKKIAKAVGPTYSSGETNTICYAASIATDTASGSYTQILTYIATGNF